MLIDCNDNQHQTVHSVYPMWLPEDWLVPKKKVQEAPTEQEYPIKINSSKIESICDSVQLNASECYIEGYSVRPTCLFDHLIASAQDTLLYN